MSNGIIHYRFSPLQRCSYTQFYSLKPPLISWAGRCVSTLSQLCRLTPSSKTIPIQRGFFPVFQCVDTLRYFPNYQGLYTSWLPTWPYVTQPEPISLNVRSSQEAFISSQDNIPPFLLCASITHRVILRKVAKTHRDNFSDRPPRIAILHAWI